MDLGHGGANRGGAHRHDLPLRHRRLLGPEEPESIGRVRLVDPPKGGVGAAGHGGRPRRPGDTERGEDFERVNDLRFGHRPPLPRFDSSRSHPRDGRLTV